MKSLINKRVSAGKGVFKKYGTVVSAEPNKRNHYGNYPLEVLWDDGTRQQTMSFWVDLVKEEPKLAKKAKTLKDLNDQITSVKATMLERRIGQTIMGMYSSEMDNMYRSQLASKLGTVSIPSLQLFATAADGLRERLIDLYNRQMNGVKGFEYIGDDVKFAQGALLDGLCYVCNLQTGEITLATMNFDILCDLDIEFDMRKQIMEKNSKGLCKAYRIDVEYLNGDQEFTFKAVNARNYDIDEAKLDTDETKQFAIAPYLAGVRLMKMCETILRNGKIMRVRQSNDGVVKIRFLTENIDVLRSYCDDPAAVSVVKSSYFPLKGFFYAPVVGAASTTAMVSRVNLFDIDNIRAAGVEHIDSAGIKKPENPVKDLIGERYFISAMLEMKGKDPEAFANMLKKLSYQGKLIKDPEKIDAKELSVYLHGVTPAAVAKAYRLVGVEDKINFAMSHFQGKFRPMTTDELANIEETLKNNVCKFTIRKNDCTLGSVFATNNGVMLGAMYGVGYFGVYESFGARFGKIEKFLNELFDAANSGADCSIGSELWDDAQEEISKWMHLPFNDEIFEDLVEKAKEYQADGAAAYVRHMKAMYAKLCNVDLKRSEAASKATAENKENGTFMCRSISAYVNEQGKVVDYYKNLSISKIVFASIVE